ncbi:hypothetical protein AGLY_005052 [Aphis glycines]|uniref:Uncharacterized protein n=1 Tax=Aphis glycines TaxID=307491 RepID=A0A6G0TW43_APHGL|nr:hypothetical protein AGLY_005052 [Aphis glycines]
MMYNVGVAELLFEIMYYTQVIQYYIIYYTSVPRGIHFSNNREKYITKYQIRFVIFIKIKSLVNQYLTGFCLRYKNMYNDTYTATQHNYKLGMILYSYTHERQNRKTTKWCTTQKQTKKDKKSVQWDNIDRMKANELHSAALKVHDAYITQTGIHIRMIARERKLHLFGHSMI